MNTPMPVHVPAPTHYLWYLKWSVILVAIGYLLYVAQPYFALFVKMVELIRKFFIKAFYVTEDIGEEVSDTIVNSKLVANKLPPTSAKANDSESSKGYCCVGEKNGLRQCTRVDKSSCSSQLYSTESQCVNPTL
jgi:hypothetical protein